MRSRPWPPTVDEAVAEIAVIGGSGFYSMGQGIERRVIDTPYGPTSDQVVIDEIGGRRVAFMARHGVEHTIPAHRVNYRANMWALHSLGVQAVVAPCSVGSLSAAVAPGHMVVLDNLIDRTHGRADTYFDGDDGVVNHVTFAHPYDEALRQLAIASCGVEGITAHPNGTVVVINGPRFSTKAESTWFASIGASVVNMTQYPEAVLAAELGLAHCGVALVTDYDSGIEGVDDRPVTMDQVLAVLGDNIGAFRRVLHRMIVDWQPIGDS